MNSWLSLVPPFIAIVLAIRTRQVVLSLTAGIFSGVWILGGINPLPAFTGTIELLVSTLARPDNARMLLFSLLIGSVVFLVQRSGGVEGFVRALTQRGLVDSPSRAGLLAMLTGTGLFLEGSMSILAAGTVGKPFFRRFRMSREKLAYIADATAAPAKVLIPLNGWGAYLTGILTQLEVPRPFHLLMSAMPFFFYPIAGLILVSLCVLCGWHWGPLKEAEERSAVSCQSLEDEGAQPVKERRAVYFILPLALLVASLIGFMFWTGHGDLTAGDGTRSILYGIFVTLAFCYPFYRISGVYDTAGYMKAVMDGMSHLLEVVMILALAFAMNAVCRELKTGLFCARLMAGNLPVFLVPVLLFLTSALISFATGTSWGTFAIMLGIAVPLAGTLGLSLPLAVGAVVSGGVWGDHCSPISDTTVLASLASGCDLMAHVRTQLPYALLGGGLAALAFLAAGVLL